MPEAALSAPRTKPAAAPLRWVPETRFGHWFLGTNVWTRYVVDVALQELAALMPADAARPRRVLDAGCGPGVSLPRLDRLLRPDSILAIDIDPLEIARSQRQAVLCQCRVEVRRGDVARLDLPDGSVDLVLCHQTLHHVVHQEEVLREFHRVLVPGGALWLAESCREFIHSTPVRLLFRHPNEVQRSAAEYQELVRRAGFTFGPANVHTSVPFWTLPDWGFRQKLGWRRQSPEPTELTLVALKAAAPSYT